MSDSLRADHEERPQHPHILGVLSVCYHCITTHIRGGPATRDTIAMATDSSHPFGALLRRFRTLAGLTQESLADRAGISVRAVSDLERGINRTPRADTLELLAAALALAPHDRAALIAAAHPDLGTTSVVTSAPIGASGSSRLPLPPTPLIGREADVLRGLRLLQRAETRLVTVTGPGGVGKTHLALELARQCQGRFASGAIFVDLSTIRDTALVPAALAQALGLRESPAEALLDTLKEALRARSMLLLLDNVEQVVGCAPLLADILAACPAIVVLATSRAPLRLRAEQVLALDPLAVSDAATLFYARATALRDDVILAPTEVTALCEQMDCLPLAIELCAAQLGALSLADLRQRMSSGVGLPHTGPRDLPARHQSLRHTIDWSYNLLSPAAQALFRRLAAFAGGATLPAIQVVCAPNDGADEDALPNVMTLVEASLLRMQDVANGPARYYMLATIHDYARDRLRDAGEQERYASRHADYFASLDGDEPSLTRELPNARAGLTWALETGRNVTGMALLARFGRIWYLSGQLSEMRTWLEAFLALDAASKTPAPLALRTNALFGAARLAYDRGDTGVAATLADESLQAAREADDAEGMSNAFVMLGQIAQNRGEVARADNLFDESLVWARKSNNLHSISTALGFYAQSAQAAGDLPRAVALQEEALAAARANGSLWGEALTETHLGLLTFAQRRYRDARRHYEHAVSLYRTFGSDIYLTWCLEGIAALDAAEGSHAHAVEICAGADALRAKGHAPRPAGEQTTFDGVLAACRVALGEDAYQSAWAVGSALARDALIGLALGEDSAGSR